MLPRQAESIARELCLGCLLQRYLDTCAAMTVSIQVATYPPALVVAGSSNDIKPYQNESELGEQHPATHRMLAPSQHDSVPRELDVDASDRHRDEMRSLSPSRQHNDTQSGTPQPRVQIDWSGVQGNAEAGAKHVAHGLHDFESHTSKAYDEMVANRHEAVDQHRTAQPLQSAADYGPHQQQGQIHHDHRQHHHSGHHHTHHHHHSREQQQHIQFDQQGDRHAPEDTFPGLYDRRQQTVERAALQGPGLVLGQVEGKVVVLGLIPHLPAALSGVMKVNDEITEVDGFAIERALDVTDDAVAKAEHEAAWLRGQDVTARGMLGNAATTPDPDSRALSLCRNLIRSAGATVRLTVRRPTFDPRKQAGVGLLLNITVNGVFVVGMAPLSSAEREGSIQVGDTLLAIGDRVLEGMTTDSLVKLLVGPQGTVITLTCRRSALPQAAASTLAQQKQQQQHPSGAIFRCALLRGNEEFFQQLDTMYHSQAADANLATRPSATALNAVGHISATPRAGPAPYSELKRIVDSHVHHAQWFQVELDLRSRSAALAAGATGHGRMQAERIIAADLQTQINGVRRRLSEAAQLETIRRQELAELQAKGPPTQVDSSAVEPLLMQVKEVIDHLIRVEQGVTSWEERATDIDKERARIASEAEAERAVRAQLNTQAREGAANRASLENNLQRQRTQVHTPHARCKDAQTHTSSHAQHRYKDSSVVSRLHTPHARCKDAQTHTSSHAQHRYKDSSVVSRFSRI